MTKKSSYLSDYYASIGHVVGQAVADPEKLRAHERKRLNLLIHHLKLPAGFWKSARALEFGPGSGENALVLARLGARITLVEPLDYLGSEIKRQFAAWNVADRIEALHESVLESFETKERYDAVFAEGFIEFLPDPLAGIEKLASFVGREGFLIFNIASPCGSFVEFMKILYLRFMINSLGAGGDWANKLSCAEALFYEEYSRIAASRLFKSWAEDLLNPEYAPSRFPEFPKILDAVPEGFHLYACWPNYLNADDLVWHKNPKTPSKLRQDTLDGFYARYPHFLHSHPSAQGELTLFPPDDGRALAAAIASCLEALEKELKSHAKSPEGIIAALEALKARYDAYPFARHASAILADAIGLFAAARGAKTKEAFARAWSHSSGALRTSWGSPGHHYAFHRSGLFTL